MDWFLYGTGLRHERVKQGQLVQKNIFTMKSIFLIDTFVQNGHDCCHTLVVIGEKNNHRNEINNKNNSNSIVILARTPVMGPKIKKELKKILGKIVFTSAANHKNILCVNKLKLLPNSYPGVYQIDSDCEGKYIGETKKCVFTRSIKHQEYCRIE